MKCHSFYRNRQSKLQVVDEEMVVGCFGGGEEERLEVINIHYQLKIMQLFLIPLHPPMSSPAKIN